MLGVLFGEDWSHGQTRRQRSVPLDYEAPPRRPRHVVPLYRKIMADILLLAGTVVAFTGLLATNVSAKTNIWTAAGALIGSGLLIRFQHIRV